MRVIVRFLRNIIILVIVVGLATAGIDYLRMTSGNVPIFNISQFNSTTRVQSYRGIFYLAERKVRVSESESLVESSHIKFQLFTFVLDVPKQFKDVAIDFAVDVKESAVCDGTTKLYYADMNIKVYTYCLDDITVKENNKSKTLIQYLEKDKSILDDIDSKLGYGGFLADGTTLGFQSMDDGFANPSLKMYRCNKPNIDDVYIGTEKMAFQNDYCTYKDDDFSFLYRIEDESVAPSPQKDGNGEDIKPPVEIFYEDNEFFYEFEYPKSDFVFLVRPAVRGREELKIPVKVALINRIVTIEDLEKKGLSFTKVNKNKPNE